jgi:hypothetical protein
MSSLIDPLQREVSSQERTTEYGRLADRRVTVENKADDGSETYVVAFVSTGRGDPAAEKQFPGRSKQQDMSRTLDAKLVRLTTPQITNYAKAGHTHRRAPQIPFFPPGGNAIWNGKDNDGRNSVLGPGEKTVQFTETCPSAGTVGMRKKHECWFV